MSSFPWSASRVGTFVGCSLRYKLSYVEGWKSTAPVNTQLADKGSAFHEAAEKYYTGMPEEEFRKLLDENIEKYHINVTDPDKDFYYNYEPAIKKFFAFWNFFVVPKEKDGWTVKKEGKVSNVISNESFIGFLDLCLEKDDEVIIVDYKTGKSVNANNYKDQQILYAYMKGLERGWSIEETAQRIKLFIFGPMIEDLESKTVEQNMMRGIKAIEYTAKDMKDIIENHYMKSINAIHTMNWARAMGNVTHACSWCPYCGSKPNDEGFEGCPVTAAAGFMTPEGIEFFKKSR